MDSSDHISGRDGDDGEPKIHTGFDSISFIVPKKEPVPVLLATSMTPLLTPLTLVDPFIATPIVGMSKTNSMISMAADDLQSGDPSGLISLVSQESYSYTEFPTTMISTATGDQGTMSHVAICVDDEDDNGIQHTVTVPVSESVQAQPAPTFADTLIPALEALSVNPDLTYGYDTAPLQPYGNSRTISTEHEIPTRTSFLYEDTVTFPTVGMGLERESQSAFSWQEYTDPSTQIWIPSEDTVKVLKSIATELSAGTHIPSREDMTMPGIVLTEDLIDKVGLNVQRIFGSPEASRRRTFTADSVTQDDNGLRELIKLGCYRAAINLTKRLLLLYGQGPGKVGHYSKHTPHSLQIWFLRISLLVRIREFSTAESELEAFKGFEKPDMFYEYYPEGSFQLGTGSMVPFYFRILAAEVPQYMRKFNDTINKLYDILYRVEQILATLNSEDEERIEIWKKRQIRVLYSLTNSSLFSKDYHNAFNFLTKLCQLDEDHLPQLKSAIARMFLQHGDITTAEMYFQAASDLRPDTDSDQVESLVDSSILAIAHNQYEEGIEFLKQALMLQPENFMIVNNLAVCHLYLGNVKESLALMETTVKQNMPQSLQENVILNLCSIYELENSDGSKKLGLLKLISEYKGDGINLASLKLPDLM